MDGTYTAGPHRTRFSATEIKGEPVRLEPFSTPRPDVVTGAVGFHAEHQVLAASYGRRNGGDEHPVIFRVRWYWKPETDFLVHGVNWEEVPVSGF